jgi:NUDIX domain-containing protein
MTRDPVRLRWRRQTPDLAEGEDFVAADGQEIPIRSNGQDWLVSWHPPPQPPDGIPHGAEGVCVTPAGEVVLISPDSKFWDLPAGRPEMGETWEDTLRREMLEEACATVLEATLVRSVWRAEVELAPWQPRFEIPHRRVVAAADVMGQLALGTHAFAPIIRRELQEASIA